MVFGTTVSGRPPDLAGVESIVGLFVNTLPMRLQVAADDSLLPWLKGLQSQMVELRQYEYSPLAEVQRWSEIPRGLPLFESILAFENSAVGGSLNELGGGVDVRTLRSEGGRTGYPLTTLALPGPELSLQISYDCRRFDTSTITRRLEHFQQLLEGMATDPGRRLSELPLLTEAERQQVLVEWNQTAVAFPNDVCLPQLFEAQVGQTPAAVAVVCEGQELTYRELNRRANQLAHYLKGLGVGTEVLVGLCVERSVEMVVGLLGILKAGGAYVPLDPAYPKDRLAFILEDTQAPLLLTQQRLVERLSQDGTRVVSLDTDWGVIAQEGETNLLCQGTTDNLAYVLYTSGSTGRPKGVAMSHRPLCNLLSWQLQNSILPRGARTLQFASLSFDVSFQEIFSTWCSGGTLVLISEEMRRDALGLWHYLRDEAVARLFLPFVALQQLAEVVEDHGSTLTGVREIITAGEQLQITRQIAGLFGKLKGCTLHNQYGPCESHVVTAFTLTGSPSDWPALPPIGCPIANTQIYLLDCHLQPVPVGVLGELYIGGVGLARGYLNRPELTAEKFIPNPFSVEPGARLYKTGDLARYRPDGNIEFLGRIDHQVKIRGFRIELGEVEAVLGQHPSVAAATVIVRENGNGDKQLVAYLAAASSGRQPEAGGLREFLCRKLPAYMVPSTFVFLEKLPLTANGKVDRRALPAPSPERKLEGYRAPRTPEEEILCGIYADLLSLERVGIDENFFSVGGHSLLAVQVVSRVRSVLGVELTVQAIFEAPSVAELTARLPGAQKAIAPLLRQERPERLPLSFAQQRLWFLGQLDTSGVEYNVRTAWRLRGELNVNALERAIDALIGRHETLRTHFEEKEGEPFQVIESEVRIPLRVEDLSSLGENERQGAIESALRREAEEPFDLRDGPLLRVGLLRLGACDHILVWSCHHIISDGWSMAVFHRDARLAYEAFCDGGSNPLESLQIQYADYALWQRSWMQGRELERLLGYWRGQLAGAATLELPTDRPRPPKPSYLGGRHSFKLGPELSARMAEFNDREKEVTPFMSLLAAFEVLLYRYSGQVDFVVGTPVANRPNIELEGLIGFFVNTLAMRADLMGEPSFRKLVSRVRRGALDGYKHQDLPFEKLVEELNPGRDMSRHPLFQVMFALQNAPREALELRGVKVSRQLLPSLSTRFDLELHLWEQGDGWSGSLVYSRDLFDEATIEGMVRHYVALLEGILEEPDRPVSQVPMMAETERERILVQWNVTGVEYPRDRCIHQVFEEQVRRAPQAVAVVYGGGQELSYGELERRSVQLAGYLRSLGVGVGARVGICMEPSAEMIVGLLAILKAGGAYVPIDPGYPEERIVFMLAESEAGVLLSREGLAGRFSGKAIKIVCLDTGWESIEKVNDAGQQSRAAGPEDVAYVLFTSGSTGTPKGVCVPHRAVNRLVVNCDYVRLGPEEAVAQISNCCFDAATFEIWGALLNGSRLVGIARERVLSAESFSAELARHGVTTLVVTTALFNELVHERANIFGKVRNVLFGGEEADPGAVRRVLESGGPPQRLLNVYGPTETTTFATAYEVGPEHSWARRIPIGRPIANTEVYVLDSHLNAVPVGVAGEICIGGDGVATGYLKRPELTEERFIASPFAGGRRLYRTGDRGRFLADGNIEFLGRLDNQVKIHGFRIELGEIEAVLRQYPAVRESVVVVREDTPGDKRLVAYIVALQGPVPAESELGGFLKEQLPAYMVPSTFMFLDELPLTPNGKVDRRALPAPDRGRLIQQGTCVAPRDILELRLTQIWEEILGLHPVGVTDNFFDLGGHSLLAVRLIARIHKQFGQKLPLPTLFHGATIERLAGVLRRSPRPPSPSPLVGIHLSGSRRPFFCVHPAGGSVLGYAGLSRRLGPDQPFYGLQHPGLDSESRLYTRIEEMASDYLATLRAVQPEGPYLLGGWSFGGIVAFEMAQQLEAEGQKVALLALLDSWALAPEKPSPAAIEGRALLALAQDLGFGVDDAAFLSDHLSRLAQDEQLTYILERVRAAHLAPPDVGLPQLRRHLYVLQTNLRARQSYRPQEYPGPDHPFAGQ